MSAERLFADSGGTPAERSAAESDGTADFGGTAESDDTAARHARDLPAKRAGRQ